MYDSGSVGGSVGIARCSRQIQGQVIHSAKVKQKSGSAVLTCCGRRKGRGWRGGRGRWGCRSWRGGCGRLLVLFLLLVSFGLFGGLGGFWLLLLLLVLFLLLAFVWRSPHPA